MTHKFKAGDLVRIKDNARELNEYPWSKYMEKELGQIREVKNIFTDWCSMWNEDKSDWWKWSENCLEPVEKTEKTWETLQKGDVIVDSYRVESEIVERLREILFYRKNVIATVYFESIQNLERFGYTIKQDNPIESITLAEAEKELGKKIIN